jgi:hypothetical protein
MEARRANVRIPPEHLPVSPGRLQPTSMKTPDQRDVQIQRSKALLNELLTSPKQLIPRSTCIAPLSTIGKRLRSAVNGRPHRDQLASPAHGLIGRSFADEHGLSTAPTNVTEGWAKSCCNLLASGVLALCVRPLWIVVGGEECLISVIRSSAGCFRHDFSLGADPVIGIGGTVTIPPCHTTGPAGLHAAVP